MSMTLQLISVELMLSNFHFFLGPSLSEISKFKILHIQFSETISSKKLDQNLVPIHNLSGIKVLTRLRSGLSHLNEHTFHLTTILMIVLILFAPAVWNPSQHHTSFCTAIIIIQFGQYYLRI